MTDFILLFLLDVKFTRVMLIRCMHVTTAANINARIVEKQIYLFKLFLNVSHNTEKMCRLLV
jgi:hypothetical protein